MLKQFRVDEELNKLIVEESDSRQKEEKKAPIKQVNNPDLNSQVDADGDIHGGGIGTISFVSCGNREAKEAAEQQTTLSDSTKEEGKRSCLFIVLSRKPSGFQIANFTTLGCIKGSNIYVNELRRVFNFSLILVCFILSRFCSTTVFFIFVCFVILC